MVCVYGSMLVINCYFVFACVSLIAIISLMFLAMRIVSGLRVADLSIPKGLNTKAVPKQRPSGVQGYENTIHEVQLFF